MICKSPLILKKPALRTASGTMTVPCQRCSSCRINKREQLVSRLELEHLASTTAQFWTLTYSDLGLEKARTMGHRHLVRNFLKAVSMHERRRGNFSPVRFFGVLEYGTLGQRPHVHMLMWNMIHSVRNPTVYKAGLPRPRHSITQWPHGHVDIQSVTPQSISYVAKYVAKTYEDDTTGHNHWEQERVITFRSQQPPIGCTGLELLVKTHSRSPTRQWEVGPELSINGRNFYPDATMKKYLIKYARRYGIKLIGLYENETLTMNSYRKARQHIKPDGQLNAEKRRDRTSELLEKLQQQRHLQRLSRAVDAVNQK